MRDGRRTRLRGANLLWLALLIALATPGCRTGLGTQFEYEEDIHLSLDGSATVYVNASLPGLAALRGLDVPTEPGARFDRALIRRPFSTPVSRVTSISTWRRHGRRFVSIRLEVNDIRLLPRAAPFSWAAYVLERQGESFLYKQTLGPSADKAVGDVGWTGHEMVAFRLHLPAKIEWHPKEIDIRRGNILVWEQPLAERRAGVPVVMEVRMQAQSILYRTLWLFGISALTALLVMAAIIWWVVKR
jgi:hypothetical protein